MRFHAAVVLTCACLLTSSTVPTSALSKGATATADQPGKAATDGEWSQLVTAGTSPSPRYGHSMIYDPVRDRLIVFGGSVAGVLGTNETWALSLGGAPTWTQLFPGGTLPELRWGHSAVYQPAQDRMVIFGGFGFGVALNDVWALSLGGSPQWVKLLPEGEVPPGGGGHSTAYDRLPGQLIVHQMYYEGLDQRSGTWTLSLHGEGAWVRLVTTGLVIPRVNHSAVFDSTRNRMLIFGGTDYLEKVGYTRNDVRELALGAGLVWSEVVPPIGRPAVREGHVALFDTARDRMVIQGGGGNGVLYSDAWAMNSVPGPQWSQLLPSGPLPAPRFRHAAAYDALRDRLIIYGGWLGTQRAGDVWALSWAQPPTDVEGLFAFAARHAGGGIELAWGVRSRGNYLGFHVLRSEGGSAFNRISPEMIPNAADAYPAILRWTDETAREGEDYSYRIEAVGWDGRSEAWDQTVTARIEGTTSPSYGLEIGGPNPLASGNTLRFVYEVPAPGGEISISVVDASGRRVATLVEGWVGPGRHAGVWEAPATSVRSSGIYFLRLEGQETTLSAKIAVME